MVHNFCVVSSIWWIIFTSGASNVGNHLCIHRVVWLCFVVTYTHSVSPEIVGAWFGSILSHWHPGWALWVTTLGIVSTTSEQFLTRCPVHFTIHHTNLPISKLFSLHLGIVYSQEHLKTVVTWQWLGGSCHGCHKLQTMTGSVWRSESVSAARTNRTGHTRLTGADGSPWLDNSDKAGASVPPGSGGTFFPSPTTSLSLPT